MIPLKDINKTKKFPLITLLLIGINISVFIFQLSLGYKLEKFIYTFSVIPYNINYAISNNIISGIYFTLITSLFLHGGWLHLIGNMLYLWVFGDNIEDKLGKFRFIVFYLLCGIAASFAQVFVDPSSQIPTIGASGAISGIIGAYILLFPKARVITLIPIFIFIQIVELPAYVILGLWIVIQFINGLTSNLTGGGIAWWAHIGGFIAGIIMILPFKKYR